MIVGKKLFSGAFNENKTVVDCSEDLILEPRT